MLNLVIIMADDMSYSSTGHAGCELPDITPNIDRLANEGTYFTNAHTSIGLCQPARSVLMTGLYPWNNGALGFEPINSSVFTLTEILKSFGYNTGTFGKIEHLLPKHKFPWDVRKTGHGKTERGKQPEEFYKFTNEFVSKHKSPFFLLLNSHYPHRDFPTDSRYNAKQVRVPGFLPDLPEIRKELAHYYEGVHCCDLTVGEIIKALEENNKIQDTLIVFTSDHGMAFPFVKAFCYHFSTKVPLVYWCPPIIPKKKQDYLVAGIDFMPTILSLLNLPCPVTDGKSYSNAIIKGESFRDYVYTSLFKNLSGNNYETRAIHNRDYSYVINLWSDGQKVFNEDGSLQKQPSFQAIKKNSPDLLNKIKFREPEEFYDIRVDSYATNNVIRNSDYSEQIKLMKNIMREVAESSGDKTIIEKLEIILNL